jgi:hypothetical protein
MKKQLLFLMATLLFSISYAQTVGDTFIDNFITYEITSLSPNNAETVDYDTNGGAVVTIPDTVTYNNIVFDVTSVGSACFFDKQLTSITIGNNIISCGQSAFRQNQLVNVVIPDNVLNIGNYSFLNNQLTNIDFGSGLTSIPEQSFQNNQFTSLNIPDNITAIGWRAFESNNQLTCITVEATVPPTIITGTGDSFNTRSNIDLTIPTGTANDYAAATWTGFNSVAEGITGNFTVNHITYAITSSTNNTVKTTDYNTTGGTVVNIPATVTRGCETYTVTEIGNNSFLQNQLTSVTIPDTVISIGEGAFNNNSISSLTLGSNVEIIGNWAFRHNSLTSLTIPNSVTSISIYAFGNNNITNLSLGSSIEIIGDSAFSENDILSLTIPDSVISIGDNAFIYSDNMTSLVIGNNVTSIGDFAFAMNPSLSILTNVTIPASVTAIGEYAFGISSLTDVTVLATIPPTITTGGTYDTFATYRSNIHLHIPPGTMGAYVTDPGALWTGFNPVTEDALSVDEFQLQHVVKIITNPESLTITSTNSLQLNSYTLYTITGAKIHTGASTEISTSTMSKGIYILALDFDQGMLIKKVMIN